LVQVCFVLGTAQLSAQVTLVQGGVPQSVIMTRPSAPGYVQKAAQDLQLHLQKMSGAVVPIATVGSESSYPGKNFVYVGTSTATTAAGINVGPLPLEYYAILTIGSNLYIVGRDGGQDDWTDLTDCQPGTLLGTSHLLGEVLGVRWLWPGDLGTYVPAAGTIVVPPLNLFTGPAIAQRKYRTPRIGLYLGGATTYGFGVPVVPTDATRRQTLATDELLWLRHQRMGTRKSPSFGHAFTQWWSLYGVTHPEYFAELLPGRTQPNPAADRVKMHANSAGVWQQIVDDWVAAGAGSKLNICPNDSRSHCVCTACLSWDRPSQAPEVVFDSSDAQLGDRYARFYTEVANRVKLINPNTTVYGYAYDVFRNAPLEATVPDNVAIAYVPGTASATQLSGIAETETNVLGWMNAGCQHMYLRPNWMLSAHAGPFWPSHRVGDHFKRLTLGGAFEGFDSDSSCGSYACFGFYYYLMCRLLADASLPVDGIIDEYCSAFGSAAARVRDYLTYWEAFAYSQADGGNTDILGWATCMAAYPGAYTDQAFSGALQILDAASSTLLPSESDARARLDFLRTACIHGRLTSQAISLVSDTVPLSSNPEAERAMRSLLAYRDANADSSAIWREWMIDRESFVPGMQSYWASILATPDKNNGSNVGTFIESGGQVAIEAENYSAIGAGTGNAAGIGWQQVVGITGSSGVMMQALPNAGISADTGQNGPRLDYKIDFHTTGTYYVFLHLPTLPGTDDSVNIGLDGTLVASNLGNTTGSWRWRTTNPTTLGLSITTPGVHTFNIWMREDGATVDKIILTTNASLALAGTDLGPAESGKRGTTEHLLTVNNGTGDGFYGESTMVPVTAATPASGWVFDRWVGNVSFLADASAASTYFQIPTADAAITATYRLAPSVDSDGDGIDDSWEIAHFGNLSPTSLSDSDGDGQSDYAEYLAGTDPRDAKSSLHISSVQRSSTNDITVQWPSVTGRHYTLQTTGDLKNGPWLPAAINIPATPPSNSYTLRLNAPVAFLRVVLE
jgi:hypothetical protein